LYTASCLVEAHLGQRAAAVDARETVVRSSFAKKQGRTRLFSSG
jgi:hypothetical protein